MPERNPFISFRVQRDTAAAHGASLSFGRKRGVNFRVQWRSWEPNPDGRDPLMLSFSVFVYGTFLGASPHGYGYWSRKCCSNGITLFDWEPIEPATPDTPWLLRTAMYWPVPLAPKCRVCGKAASRWEHHRGMCWQCGDKAERAA